MDAWLYRGSQWLVTDENGAHVQHESRTVNFAPEVVSTLEDHMDDVAKIVGVSDDDALVAHCEAEAHATLLGMASASRSQPYYLDITNVEANKGQVVLYLSSRFHIATDEIATIGDSQNDVLMFQRSGLSIAMGNATDQVKAQAGLVTVSNNEEGFAKAIERFILTCPG
jgi:HAD superfamily hydrolase (TIGR01484 family)